MILYLLKYYLETKLFSVLPEGWVKKKQIKRVRRIFEWSKENSKFYKKMYADAGVLDLQIRTYEDIQKIPIIDKDMILSYQTEFVLTCPKSNKLAINRSSGSTGKSIAVYSTKKELFTSYVRTFLALKAYNPFKSFVFIGLYKQKEKNEKHSFLYYCQKYLGLFKREIFSVFTPPEEIRNRLSGGKINVLFSTPSCIKMLVDEVKNSGEKLSVKYVVVSDETVFDDFKDDVKTYLQAKIINVYGGTEHLSMAWTTPDEESFSCASNSVFVEYINPVEINGDLYGELVLTNLVNKTMPFVRYNIRDNVKIIASNKKMGKVIGRIEDIIDLDGGKKLFRLKFCSMFKTLSECKQFKILQKKDKNIYFRTTCKTNEDTHEVKNKIIKIWKDNIGDYPIEVEFLDELPVNLQTGKFKII